MNRIKSFIIDFDHRLWIHYHFLAYSYDLCIPILQGGSNTIGEIAWLLQSNNPENLGKSACAKL